MSHMPDYDRGRRDGIRWAITLLHERAREMNDPHARGVLNTAAFNMSTEKEGFQPSPLMGQQRHAE